MPSYVTLISDTFTDTNGTAITSHTVSPTNTPGNAYSSLVGTTQIQSNKAEAQDASNHVVIIDAEVALKRIRLTGTIPNYATTRRVGIVARATDSSNYIRCMARADATAGLYIETVESAAVVSSATVAHSYSAGNAPALLVEILADDVVIVVDETNNIAVGLQTAFLTGSTNCGFIITQTGSATTKGNVDGFIVSELQDAASGGIKIHPGMSGGFNG